MATIKCKYFDKAGVPVPPFGDLCVSFGDFAHALLSLHGKLGSPFNKSTRYLSYLLQISSDFRVQDGRLVMNKLSDDCYDGIKKLSDVYGAVITVLLAQKIYHHKVVVPLTKGSVCPSSGERPDFFATDGTHHSLFESKASIDYVSASAREKGIQQLNAISSVQYDSISVSNFKEKVVVCTDFRHDIVTAKYQGVQCKIFDPDNEKAEAITLNLTECLSNYYEFVRSLINLGKETTNGVAHNGYTLSTLSLDRLHMVIGMRASLYDFNWKRNDALSRFFATMKDNITEGDYFGDGVYLEVTNDSWLKLENENDEWRSLYNFMKR